MHIRTRRHDIDIQGTQKQKHLFQGTSCALIMQKAFLDVNVIYEEREWTWEFS
jgi:hypothetical protein